MKKTIYSILAVTAGVILGSGCSKDNIPDVTCNTTLSAVLSDDLTKTAVDGTDKTKVNWSAGDALSVWGGENNKFTLSAGEGTTSGNFSGTVTTGTAQYALYPYSSTATISDGVIMTKVPNTQTVPASSFDPAAAIMVGTISGATITFHHAVAYLKITAPANVTNLVEITIESNGGVRLTGDAMFTASSGTFTATGIANNFVTVKPEGGTFTAGGIYYAAVIPGTYTGGLTVKYIYGNDTNHSLIGKSKSSSTALTLAAGNAKLLGAATTFESEKTIAVQLWAGGPYWATTNIGAASEKDFGQYFAWGYTEGCVRNSQDNGWVLASDGATVKSFQVSYFPFRDESTYQDAAAANWGSAWSVPAVNDFGNLISDANTEIEYVCEESPSWSTYQVPGILVKGKGGYTTNSIFLPAAGVGIIKDIFSKEEEGNYFSSEQQQYDGASILWFVPQSETINNGVYFDKACGCPVRPIRYK